MPAEAPAATRDEILRLAHAGLGAREFAGRAARVLNRAVPFDGGAIVACDPATALPTAKWVENSVTGDDGLRLMDMELREPDVNKISELALSGRPAASLKGATDGKLDRSPRYRELLRPRGFGDELRAVCLGGSRTWGLIVLHRDRASRDFAERDVDVLASLSGAFAEGFARAGLSASEGPAGEPGLLVLDDEDGVELANDAAPGWLEELHGGEPRLPLVVSAVAHRARAIASGHGGAAATARAPTASGRWALIRGSVLANGSRSRTAVTIQAPSTAELAALIVQAYGLTERERVVTELVARGLPTAVIAGRLHLSPFTVQDHLKVIFEKLGVSTRGELVARLFVDYCQAGLTQLDDPA